jgi:hypothetical protein
MSKFKGGFFAMVFKLLISGYGWWSIFYFSTVWRWYALVVLQCCCTKFMVICYVVLLWWFGHVFQWIKSDLF